MDKLEQHIWETRMKAHQAMLEWPERRKHFPWQLRFRIWLDSLGGSVDIWEVIAIVLLIRLIFG
jgi:hypothetical protein